MAGNGPTEVHTATVPVDHSQFTVFDAFGDDSIADLPARHDPTIAFTAGRGGALFYTADRTLYAAVTLEIWPHAPHGHDEPTDQAFHTPTGRVLIACITASPMDKAVPLHSPGDYHLRAHRTGTRNIAEDGDPDVYEEAWTIQIWPKT